MKARPWLALGVLLWLAFGLAYYYAFHRPFTPQFAVQLARAGRDLLCTGLLFSAAGALGTRLLGALDAAPLARLAVRAALGLGALSFLYLLLGSSIGTQAWLAWAALAIVLGLLRRSLASWWQDAASLATLWAASGRLGRLLAGLCALIFAGALLVALAPPLAFDALVYHLSLPKLYIANGQVGYLSEIMYWGFPQVVHMLMTWAAALGATQGAVVAWGMGLLAALGLLGQLSQQLSARAAWVALAALLSGASLVTALSSAYVDWPGLLMGWGVLFFLELWLRQRQARWALWAGVLCGLAFGSKYTAGIYAPLGGLVFVLAGKPDWRALLRYLAAALVCAAPWLLRNALATGNPFYPLLLPGGEMDAIRLGYYQGFAAQGNWLDALLLPFRATWLGIEGGHIGNAAGYETSLGPLLLLFGLLALLPAGVPAAAHSLKRSSVIVALGGLFVWALAGRLTGHLIRSHLYFSLFPAFATLAAFGFENAQSLRLGAVRVGRLAAASTLLALALSALGSSLGLVQRGVLEWWSGALDDQAYRQRNLGLYALVMPALPDDGRTLMLWETRGWACLPNCEPDEIIDRWPHDLQVSGSPAAVLARWRAEGYAYVLYYRLGAQFVYADPQHFHTFDLRVVEDTLGSLPVVENFNEDYVLYRLQP